MAQSHAQSQAQSQAQRSDNPKSTINLNNQQYIDKRRAKEANRAYPTHLTRKLEQTVDLVVRQLSPASLNCNNNESCARNSMIALRTW
jgi:hypothetical protein